MRFQMHPWNGTLALLELCSTAAGIPPRKMRCKLTGWSLGSAASRLASSSTWTARDLDAVLGSPDHAPQTVAAGEQQDLQRAFVEQDGEVGLQETEAHFIICVKPVNPYDSQDPELETDRRRLMDERKALNCTI
ncbi:hypothetical protein EYF80_060528 [Liparis tanakae]|uniref:Uncharacterized protein n=1 Tax=Liparis tanakae TaxID=230148 RepID=A0A4Z2ELL0_9TELE|nr:hypothetical protein EYF80_060528 [Liparis tanakae]